MPNLPMGLLISSLFPSLTSNKSKDIFDII